MRRDDRSERETLEREGPDGHVVFDFTGLERPNAMDLALILTARLNAGPEAEIWVRSVPWQTATVLRALRLDHLFRLYPADSEDELN